MDAPTWPRKEHQRSALGSQNAWERLKEASDVIGAAILKKIHKHHKY